MEESIHTVYMLLFFIGKDKSGGKSKKSVSQSQVAESSPKRPPRANLGAKKGDDFRPVSMMVNNEVRIPLILVEKVRPSTI